MLIKLTKQILEKLWYGKWDRELVKQILDDYEKARKWEKRSKDKTIKHLHYYLKLML